MSDQQCSDYWVGSLAMTVALATVDPDPKRLCRKVVQEFLASRPPGNELAALIREAMKGK